MRHSSSGLILLCLMTLPACDNTRTSPSEPEVPSASEAQAEQAEPSLSAVDLVRVCKAGHAFSVGRSVDGMEASTTSDEIVRLSYTRDDGKRFRYDCKVEGGTIRTRMIDEAGPRSGPGAWSGRGGTTTFELTPDSILVREVYPDGSAEEGSIEI